MKDATVLVTGAAAGIGRAVADAAMAAGARVLAWDIADAASPVSPDRIMPARVDVSDASAVDAALARSTAAGWAPTHLVNNAGIIGRRMALDAMEPAEIDRVLAVNVRGPLLVTSAFLRHRMAHPAAAIVNMASIAGQNGGAPGNAIYGASKGALLALTQAMARDLAPSIRVNALMPGIIDTDIQKDVFASREDMESRAASIPLARIGTADDVARATLWLLFSAAYTTGEAIAVSGGRR